MVSTMEIKCINKDDRQSPYERITHIGGINPNGTLWRMTQQEAIRESRLGNGDITWKGRAATAYG